MVTAEQTKELNVQLHGLDPTRCGVVGGISREVTAVLAEGSLRHETHRPGPLAEARPSTGWGRSATRWPPASG